MADIIFIYKKKTIKRSISSVFQSLVTLSIYSTKNKFFTSLSGSPGWQHCDPISPKPRRTRSHCSAVDQTVSYSKLTNTRNIFIYWIYLQLCHMICSSCSSSCRVSPRLHDADFPLLYIYILYKWVSIVAVVIDERSRGTQIQPTTTTTTANYYQHYL